MIRKINIRVWHVNFVEVNLKKRFHQVLEQLLHRPETLANGIVLVTGRATIWKKQKQSEESQKEIQKWELLKTYMEKQIDFMKIENLINIFNSIDNKVVETWTEDKTFGDLMSMLSDDELKIFYKLKLVDSGLDITDKVMNISLKIPKINDINNSNVRRIFIF
jgi:hypothetical protein